MQVCQEALHGRGPTDLRGDARCLDADGAAHVAAGEYLDVFVARRHIIAHLVHPDVAMTIRPTLFLTVGLPGTGKTTEARRLEVEEQALRLTKDEWVKALYGLANPPSASDVIEGRLIEIGLPPWLLAFCYAFVGWNVGLNFTRDILAYVWRVLPKIIAFVIHSFSGRSAK